MAKNDKIEQFIRIVGDCGHPWYVIPEELDRDVKLKPLKCPFCDCEGAPVQTLIDELKAQRRKVRKAGFREQRRRKK